MSAFVVPGLVLAAFLGAPPEDPFHKGDFATACKLAKEKGKVVMVDFYTVWCGPCKMLDRNTWPDERVRNFLVEKTIPMKVNAEADRELARRYQIMFYPTIVFVKPDGVEIGRVRGYSPPAEFLMRAAGVLSPQAVANPPKQEPTPPPEPVDTTSATYRLDQARVLIREKKHKEALDELTWCFDHGHEKDPSFIRVRVGVLSRMFAELGQAYPPAREAISTRRDAAQAALVELGEQPAKLATRSPVFASGGTVGGVMELLAINRALGQTEKSVALYEALRAAGERTAALRTQLVRDEVLDALLASQRYREIVEDGGDMLFERLNQQISGCKESTARTASVSTPGRDRIASFMRQRTVADVSRWYQALLGADQKTRAEYLADKLIDLDGTGVTYATLIDRALRVGAYDAARLHVTRAEEKLQGADLSKVREAAAKIPPRT